MQPTTLTLMPLCVMTPPVITTRVVGQEGQENPLLQLDLHRVCDRPIGQNKGKGKELLVLHAHRKMQVALMFWEDGDTQVATFNRSKGLDGGKQ